MTVVGIANVVSLIAGSPILLHPPRPRPSHQPLPSVSSTALCFEHATEEYLYSDVCAGVLLQLHWCYVALTISKDENAAISALTGFSLDHVLSGLRLPSGDGLSNRLGIAGLPSLSSKQIYNDSWDDDAIGADQGQDWEDEVDRELENEVVGEETHIKEEIRSPVALRKEKRVRVVRKLVERPKTVYERFPAFEQGKVLDFTELFKGYVAKKSRVGKRQLQGKYRTTLLRHIVHHHGIPVETVNPRMKELPKNYLKSVVGAAKRQVETKRVEEKVAAGSVEDDLRLALEVHARSLAHNTC